MSLHQTVFTSYIGDPVRETFVGNDLRIAERTYAPHMRVPVHTHDEACVRVTLSGVYTQTCKGETREFRPGSISFMPCAEPHESQYSETGARVLHIEIPAPVLHNFSSAGLESQNFIVLRGGAPQIAAQQLYQEFQSPDALSPLILNGLTMRFLAQIFRKQSPSPKRPAKWLEEAERYICEKYRDPLPLDKIAKAVHVHPVHLAREYRRFYKRTVGERIRELRFEVACRELLGKSRSLVEIALSAGYSDQSHFSVAFKKHMGMAPSEYRRRHLETNFAKQS